MSKFLNYLPLLAALVIAYGESSTQAAVISTPGLIGVRFWEATGPVTPYTVSYTHLDVYKRQIKLCFATPTTTSHLVGSSPRS